MVDGFSTHNVCLILFRVIISFILLEFFIYFSHIAIKPTLFIMLDLFFVTIKVGTKLVYMLSHVVTLLSHGFLVNGGWSTWSPYEEFSRKCKLS